MPKELTPTVRQALKGKAHRLDPVVMIGADGLTPGVLTEIERALRAHELIKIRVVSGDGGTREALLGEICVATDAAPVQHIGKVLVVYRERPADEQPPPPPPPRKPPPRRRDPGRPPRRAKLRSR